MKYWELLDKDHHVQFCIWWDVERQIAYATASHAMLVLQHMDSEESVDTYLKEKYPNVC